MPGYDAFMAVAPMNMKVYYWFSDFFLVPLGFMALFFHKMFKKLFHKPPTMMAAPYGFIFGAIPEIIRWLLISPIAYPVCIFNWTVDNVCEGIQSFYSWIAQGLNKTWAWLTSNKENVTSPKTSDQQQKTVNQGMDAATAKPQNKKRSTLKRIPQNAENVRQKDQEKAKTVQQEREKNAAKEAGEKLCQQGEDLFTPNDLMYQSRPLLVFNEDQIDQLLYGSEEVDKMMEKLSGLGGEVKSFFGLLTSGDTDEYLIPKNFAERQQQQSNQLLALPQPEKYQLRLTYNSDNKPEKQ